MATAYVMDEPEPRSEDEIRDKLNELVGYLQGLADDQVRRKAEVEERWLEDLRAFHGRYAENVERDLIAAEKSRAFVKITRKKTNSWDARLGALMFPTDDENWDIRPTPVPTLHEAAKAAMEAAEKQVAQANEMQEVAATAAPEDPAAAEMIAAQAEEAAAGAQESLNMAAQLQQAVAEARKRSEAMRMEMKDQLIECNYAAEARLAIRDACRIGTGVLKGPLSSERQRGTWALNDNGKFSYEREADPAPVFRWVDPWAYFPDMSALRPDDREFEFERHLWSGKDLRRLVKDAKFSAQSVREILEGRRLGTTVTDSSLGKLSSLRSITGSSDVIKDRYIGWEFHGYLACEQIAIIMRALGQEEEAAVYEAENDPLHEMKVICFFCEGKILKLSSVYPLDSNESLYSLFIFEPSEASLFGYGVPAIMADSQKAMNGAWRMALDNAALSVGPQIFLDKEAIEPANRRWDLTPRKVWYKRKGAGMTNGNIMEAVNIPNNVEEIMNLVRTARQFIDDETALPVQAEGELTDNPNITATATNFMSMASNITFRRVVKNFDDGVTAPSMGRLYDWNMQHNAREDIKGDMKVDARGASHLLQREMQAQMLLNVAQNWLGHPMLGKLVKPYEAVADALKASMIQPEMIMPSKEEYEASVAAEQQAAASAEPPKEPTVVAAEVRLQAAQVDADSRLKVAEMQREIELMQMAQQYNIDLEKLATMLGMEEMKIESKERTFAAEAALEEKRQQQAAATGEKPKGSGGYL